MGRVLAHERGNLLALAANASGAGAHFARTPGLLDHLPRGIGVCGGKFSARATVGVGRADVHAEFEIIFSCRRAVDRAAIGPKTFSQKMASPLKQKYFGIFSRRERWGLSARGWIFFIALILLAGFLWIKNVRPFLAQTKREDTKILVVEGWVRNFAMNAAVAEFHSGHYAQIYTTGGPIAGSDGATNDFNTSASVGADWLVTRGGLPAESVQMVPSHVAGRDRTYSSALALKNWFRAHNVSVKKINVLTEDCHARRTRLLFQKAFGDEVEVGIIAAPNPDYDPQHWWHYSEGVREILGENIAYIYAEFLFYPEKSGEQVP